MNLWTSLRRTGRQIRKPLGQGQVKRSLIDGIMSLDEIMRRWLERSRDGSNLRMLASDVAEASSFGMYIFRERKHLDECNLYHASERRLSVNDVTVSCCQKESELRGK